MSTPRHRCLRNTLPRRRLGVIRPTSGHLPEHCFLGRTLSAVGRASVGRSGREPSGASLCDQRPGKPTHTERSARLIGLVLQALPIARRLDRTTPHATQRQPCLCQGDHRGGVAGEPCASFPRETPARRPLSLSTRPRHRRFAVPLGRAGLPRLAKPPSLVRLAG